MYANTKKELFLEKRPFEAQKLTPDELMDKMSKCIFNNVDVEGEGYDDGALRLGDIETIFEILRDLIERENDGDSNVIGQILVKDLPVDGAQLAGGAEDDDWIEVVTLVNGFTYIKVLSVLGDDSLVPVYVVLYIGSDDMIHGFIPMCGNNVFAETNVQLGAIGGNDADAWAALLDEYGVEYDIDDPDPLDYGKACFETYAKKYGVEGTLNDANYEDGEYVETMLELNDNYIVEDILSNVTLV